MRNYVQSIDNINLPGINESSNQTEKFRFHSITWSPAFRSFKLQMTIVTIQQI